MALGKHIAFDIEKFRLNYDDEETINIVFSEMQEVDNFISYMHEKYSIDLFDIYDMALELFRRYDYVVLDKPDYSNIGGIDKDGDDDFYEGDYYYSDITFDEILSFNIESSDLMNFLTA